MRSVWNVRLDMSRRLNQWQQNSSCVMGTLPVIVPSSPDMGVLLDCCFSLHIISVIHCATQPPVAVTNDPGLPPERFSRFTISVHGWLDPLLLGLSQSRKSFREHVTEQICSIHDILKVRPERRKRLEFQGTF